MLRWWFSDRPIRHPQFSSPFDVRLSKWSLPVVLVTYLIFSLVWILLVAGLLVLLERPQPNALEAFRQSAWALWGPDNLFDLHGQSASFYSLAILNAVVGVLLPLFVLGAFVFKLFRHDPLVWRRSVSLEAHTMGHYVLAIRFYNGFRVPLADVQVRAWLRWRPESHPTVFRNKQLRLFVRGDGENGLAWPLAMPAEPTTVRVYLEPTSGTYPLFDDKILIQGEEVKRDDATIVLIAQGMASSLNEEFRSIMQYSLEGIDEGLYQDVRPGQLEGPEWDNFDGMQTQYVFVYGSLMRHEDLRAAGLEGPEHLRATLDGWRRCWNVASDPARKNRVYRKADGTVFPGWVGSLGLERSEGEEVHGIVVEATPQMLANFDTREQDYDRTDVSDAIVWRKLRPSGPHRVYTYIPKPEAVREYERRRRLGGDALAIAESYFTSVKAAAAEVEGTDSADFDQAVTLHGVPVIPLVKQSANEAERQIA
jgi:cation transport regulator ChaC